MKLTYLATFVTAAATVVFAAPVVPVQALASRTGENSGVHGVCLLAYNKHKI